MIIQFDGIYERDMDFLFMRKISEDEEFVRKFFLSGDKLVEKGYDKAGFTVEKVSHSVMADRKSTRLNSSHPTTSRMPSSA